MPGRIGKITADPEVRRAKNGDADVLMLTVRFSDGGTASAQWMPGSGEDTAPQRNDIVAVERYGGVLIANAAKSPGGPARKPGERELYSRDGAGQKAAALLMKADGSAGLSSRSAAGTPAAAHGLKPGGTQYVGNAAAGVDLFTVMDACLTALITALTAATSGSPPPTLDPGALAAFSSMLSAASALKTQWALIFDPVPPDTGGSP
jgi:hypothetical protein